MRTQVFADSVIAHAWLEDGFSRFDSYGHADFVTDADGYALDAAA